MVLGASLPSMAASDPPNLTERSSTDCDTPVLSEACPPRRRDPCKAARPGARALLSRDGGSGAGRRVHPCIDPRVQGKSCPRTHRCRGRNEKAYEPCWSRLDLLCFRSCAAP